MKEKKRTSLLLIALLLILGVGTGLLGEREELRFPDLPPSTELETTDLGSCAIQENPLLGPVTVSKSEAGHTNYAHERIYVDESFQSNLPLVIIDTGNKKPGRGVRWDSGKQYYVPTGEDPYAYGTLQVIEGARTQVTDPPAVTTPIKIKIRGNSSGTYDKKQYRLRTLDPAGSPTAKNLLDLGSGNDWVLNVSFADKSLLRNFLALSATGVLREESPDVRYCEVLWKENDRYRYDGVYLMMESVSVGKTRVDLPKYAENTENIPALYRRDRYTVNDLMLENYAFRQNRAEGRIGVRYPNREVLSPHAQQQLTLQVDRLEESLNSSNLSKFYQYRNYVDVDSFVDYFLINEFFLNYDAGYNSTYFFTDYAGRIHMGPVWDFDQAMDNSSENAAQLDTTAFHSAPWFDQMLRDPLFTQQLEKRYHTLRKTLLSDESIIAYLDAIEDHLGPAVDWDWARWGYYYRVDAHLTRTGESCTTSWQEEVNRIQDTLLTHAHWLDAHIDSLYQFKDLPLEDVQDMVQEQEQQTAMGSLLAVTFVIAFFVSVILVLRKESE